LTSRKANNLVENMTPKGMTYYMWMLISFEYIPKILSKNLLVKSSMNT
jgi:hypothetical protein